jgi:DNA repair exonuclease SbcCD ATPase subunit
MEHSQLSQMVTWLDKEHQRDRTNLHQLQQRVETLIEERDEQAHRITDLETKLAALNAHVDRVAQMEGYFERFKHEITAMSEKSETRRQQAMRDSDLVRQVEIDNVTRAVSEIRKEVERTRRYDEELAARRADTQRLSESVARLQQQLLESNKLQDERVRGIAYLEEQRHQDNKRLAQLQAQSSDLIKKVEGQLSRIQQLEQFPPRIGEVRTSIEEVRQQHTKELERAQFQDAQRERQMKTWHQEAELQRQRMDEFSQQMERYAEQYHRIKKSIEDLEEFKEQLQRQQHETTELQRLAENRQRTQLEEWQVQEERRWKKHTMEWDHHWGEYDKSLADLTVQIAEFEKQAQDNEKRLELLLEMAEEDVQMRATAARDWQTRFEEMVEQA